MQCLAPGWVDEVSKPTSDIEILVCEFSSPKDRVERNPFQMGVENGLEIGGPILNTYKSWDDAPSVDKSTHTDAGWLLGILTLAYYNPYMTG